MSKGGKEIKRLLVVGILSAVLLLESEAHLDVMHLTCRPQAGCEVFDVCTKSAMMNLRSEIQDLVENKLKISNESFQKSLKEIQEQSKDRSIDIEAFRADIEAEMEDRITELQQKLNETILDLKKLTAEKNREERHELDKILNGKVEETVTKMAVSVKKAQGEMDKASKREMEQLRGETEKLVAARFTEISKTWMVLLGQTKNDLMATVHNATSTMNRRIADIEDKVTEIWSNVNASLLQMKHGMNARLQQIVIENINLSDVEQMIDDKVNEAKLGWGLFSGSGYYDEIDGYFFGDEEANHNGSASRKDLCKVSHTGKCFWVAEPELAVTFASAARECERKGGAMGNIYDKAHLDSLYDYLRSLILVKRMYIDVWTGMTIDPRSGEVFYTNRSVADFTEWEPGSPVIGKSFSEWTGIYLVAKKDQSSIHQGMVNSSPESIRDGVLCEI